MTLMVGNDAAEGTTPPATGDLLEHIEHRVAEFLSQPEAGSQFEFVQLVYEIATTHSAAVVRELAATNTALGTADGELRHVVDVLVGSLEEIDRLRAKLADRSAS
jgi:hypothetical protein